MIIIIHSAVKKQTILVTGSKNQTSNLKLFSRIQFGSKCLLFTYSHLLFPSYYLLFTTYFFLWS